MRGNGALKMKRQVCHGRGSDRFMSLDEIRQGRHKQVKVLESFHAVKYMFSGYFVDVVQRRCTHLTCMTYDTSWLCSQQRTPLRKCPFMMRVLVRSGQNVVCRSHSQMTPACLWQTGKSRGDTARFLLFVYLLIRRLTSSTHAISSFARVCILP